MTQSRMLSALSILALGGGLLELSNAGQLGPEAAGQDTSPEVVSPQAQARRSVFGDVLHLGEEPPETRTIAAIQLLYAGCEGAPRDLERDLDGALAVAAELRQRLLAGEPFEELAKRHSSSNTAPTGGVLGSFPRGFLLPDFEAFLFDSEVGEISEPVVAPTGVHLLTRVERFAAARVIAVTDRGPKGREKLAAIAARLHAGEDFGALARELSEDPVTSARDGALAVFERGRGDMLLKAATFNSEVGEVTGPIDTPRGLYLVQRVEPDLIPLELHEDPWIDLRGILLTYDSVSPPVQAAPRSFEEAEELALELVARIRAGEDMAELARTYDDDHGGRERAGRIGWIHRHQPGLASYWKALWRKPAGQVEGPVALPIGQLIYRRER